MTDLMDMTETELAELHHRMADALEAECMAGPDGTEATLRWNEEGPRGVVHYPDGTTKVLRREDLDVAPREDDETIREAARNWLELVRDELMPKATDPAEYAEYEAEANELEAALKRETGGE